MRRTAAALAATALTVVVLTGPLAMPGQAGPPSSLSCAGAATTPECVLLDQLAAQLAPLQPVLALAGPVLAQVAPAAQNLAVLADQPGGVPTAAVRAQAQALLDQLNALPAPVRALLAAAQLDGLSTTLSALVTALAPVTGEQTAAESSRPTPAKTGGSTGAAPATSTSSGLPTLGGSLAGPDDRGAGTSRPAIPDVPVGDSLTLAPLALPDFGFSPTFESSAEVSPAATEAAADPVQAIAAEGLSGEGAGTEIGIVIVLSLMLLGAAFAAQTRQNRHTIPD